MIRRRAAVASTRATLVSKRVGEAGISPDPYSGDRLFESGTRYELGGDMGRARRALEPRAPQCKARTRPDPETGERGQCKNFAIRGTVVCRMHGGSVKATRNKAAQRVEQFKADAKISRYLENVGYEPVENPLEALKDLAGEVVAVKNWLRDQVDNLSHESTVQGDQISSIMQLYSNFLDKSERILVNIGKLNIDERLAHIQTTQAQVMMIVFAEALNKVLGQDVERKDQAKVVIGQLLQKYDR